MKRILSIVLLLTILLCMMACGNENQQGQTDADSSAIRKMEEDTVKKDSQSGKRSFDFEKKTVTLNSGYEIPLNGIGTYSLEDDTCVKSVSEALKRGVRLIDTAYMYHNEEEVGKAVRQSGIPREKIFVTTKLYPNQFADAENAIDEAVEKLNIGYIDLMLLHHPGTDDVKAYKTSYEKSSMN